MIAIYARVSTEEQAKSGFSLDYQIREGKKIAGTNDVDLYLDEGISGEFLERPALTRLRTDVKSNRITKVICLDPDRLARKLMLQLLLTEEFERRGATLVFVSCDYAKTPEGQLFYSMRGAIAEFEKAKINERMSRGRLEKAKQGKVIKDDKIFGYTFNRQTSQLEVQPQEAAVVQLIFNLYTNTGFSIEGGHGVQGLNGIANYLMKREIPTKKGGTIWHRQVVKQILSNRTYIGLFCQNKWNTEGMLGNKHRNLEDKIKRTLRPKQEWIIVKCPQIISEFQFEHAQQILENSKNRWLKQSKRKYLLSGILRCADCGNTMSGRKHSHWGKDLLIYTCTKKYGRCKPSRM